ncbi:MAG: AAA family ATPase [Alistipes sp.]|nr:AAA family ATPase [Alistipes sp.]
MMYLDSFKLPTVNQEEKFFERFMGKFVPAEIYPWRFLSTKGFTDIDCEPITILYGGNGSGKSTALNAIAQTIGIERKTLFNRGVFHYDDFIAQCSYKTNPLLKVPLVEVSSMITSDEVFDSILDTRKSNAQHDLKSAALADFYDDPTPVRGFDCDNPASMDRYIQYANSTRKSKRGFIRGEIGDKRRTFSNGETAYLRIIKNISEGLYLLDEPENSLSARWQSKLAEFIKMSAYSCDCQFIIATHSPFLLGIEGAKIYNLDEEYVTISEWHELESTKLYYELFKKLDGKI